MSTRPALVALLLTLLLAIGAYFVLRSAPGRASDGRSIPQGERTLIFDAATLKAFSIRTGSGPQQIVERGADGRWYWRSSAAAKQRFALDDARVRAFLRLLAESRGVAAPSANPQTPDAATWVVLGLHGPEGDTTLRLAPRPLGGQVSADVATPSSPQPRAAIVSEEILAVLGSPGPSSWRDTRAMTVDPATATKVAFTDGSGKNGFGLEKRAGQWFLAPPAPAGAPAEPEPVTQVFRILDSLTITRFYDGDDAAPAARAAAFDKPTAVLTVECEDRAIDPATQAAKVTPRTLTLTFGQPADTEGTTLFATPDGGATVFAVGASPLTKLTAPSESLVMKAATRTPAADVGAVVLRSASGARTMVLARDSVSGRWTESLDDAAPVTLDTAKAAGAESILVFFTRTGSDAARFAGSPEDKAIASAELRSPGGQPLDRFELLLPGGGGAAGGSLIVSGGGVLRHYAQPPADLLDVLARLAR